MDRARSAISHENSEELAGIMLEVEKLSLPEKEAGDFIQRVFFGFIFKSNFNPPRDFVAQFQERLQAEPSSLGKLLGLMMDYISPMPKEALALSVLDDLEKKRIPRTEETLRCVLQSLVKHQNISVESLFFFLGKLPPPCTKSWITLRINISKTMRFWFKKRVNFFPLLHKTLKTPPLSPTLF